MTRFYLDRKILGLIGLTLLFMLLTEPALAAKAGGNLPFDTWLDKVRSSITGPFAFTAAIIGLVGAGAMLIFGGDMNGFLRTLIFVVLVMSFLVAAQNTLKAITGQGAEVSALASYIQTGESAS
ncbi:TrbC/VirB2 family protein [Legionella geestiana]|uniref:TrbC/VirB2 family protein n=1 Tax=Legionella geestiana TaxID=45065 RepID=UPI00056C2423|nr:TrbC/VirB2 family protein [Legionella geestiana]QBS13506.1 conjugal transfer protein TrbC [Legionella geestiana]STX59216.1 Conjugal transfer protein [Legionella geestiana]